MGKKALLIGFSTYQALEFKHLNPSPALQNLNAVAKVLQSEVGQYSESDISMLINPDAQQIRQAIDHFSSRCQPGDRRILYFCGLGLIDPKTQATYLGAYDTDPSNLLSTAISSEFLQAALGRSHSRHQLVILDSCWQPGPAVYPASLDLRTSTITQLGSSARAVLLAANHADGWDIEADGLSACTHYLVEGIGTGLADIEADGFISARDLYQYLRNHLQPVDSSPYIWLSVDQNSEGIKLFELPGYQPEAEYRSSVEAYVTKDQGAITEQSRKVLDFLRQQIGISGEDSLAIETSVLEPYRELQARLKRYEQAFIEVIQLENPPNQSLRRWLKHLQQALELSYEDTIRIETRVVAEYGPAGRFQSAPHPGEALTATAMIRSMSTSELNHNS